MRLDHYVRFVATAILTSVLGVSSLAEAQTVETRIGTLDFELGVPTKETSAKLYDEIDFQRACQLYLWALPAVNVAQMSVYIDFTAGGCVFRTNAIGDFGGRRSLIPGQGDRSFRAWRSPISGKPIACFGQGDR